MGIESLSINLATVRQQWNVIEAAEACARHGIPAVDPWRDQVAAVGLGEAVRAIKDNGLRVSGYCRGGDLTMRRTASVMGSSACSRTPGRR